MRSALFAAAIATTVFAVAAPSTLGVDMRVPTGFTKLRAYNESSLHSIDLPSSPSGGSATRPAYTTAPYVLRLKGTRYDVGYAYAELMAEATSDTYTSFLGHITDGNKTMQDALGKFSQYLWDSFYVHHTPARFLTELRAMETWAAQNPTRASALAALPATVSRHFFVLANMPADAQNIMSALLWELQTHEEGLPAWLRHLLNDIIKALEKLIHGCDAMGVWGPRTTNGRLYTSRNLDFNANSGIDAHKLITLFDIDEPGPNGAARIQYSTMGYAFGPGALAGQSLVGVTTSEMNLDNSRTTFSGLVFPLRLRYVLERSWNLQSAMAVWNATNNTDSMNYLIGSAADTQAYALEAIRGFTAEFPADSPIEAAATYDCGEPPHVDPTCKKWVVPPQQPRGIVHIGTPLPHCVWRTNHGLSPVVMATQEPLFNDTMYRYRLFHQLFTGFEAASVPINDTQAVEIVATLGIKGDDFFTCHGPIDPRGSKVILSVIYVPAEQRFFVSWEGGMDAGQQANWRPASCMPYTSFDLAQWFN